MRMNPSGVESGGWANSFAAKLGEGVGRGMISIWRLRRQTSKEDERCIIPTLSLAKLEASS